MVVGVGGDGVVVGVGVDGVVVDVGGDGVVVGVGGDGAKIMFVSYIVSNMTYIYMHMLFVY